MGIMNHATSEIVQQMLINGGQGSLPEEEEDWPVYADNEPNQPDNLIIIIDTAGVVEGRTSPDGETIEQEGIQITVRSTHPREGFVKARAIAKWIDDQDKFSVTLLETEGTAQHSYRIEALNRVGSVMPIGKEQNASERYLTVANYLAAINETTE